MTPTLDPQTADVITFWIALAVAMAGLALLLAVIALARVSRLRRSLTEPTFGTPAVHQTVSSPVLGTRTHTVADPQSAAFSPSSVSPRVRQLAATGRKIEAIKALREESGLGLRAAKEIVDGL